MTIPGIPGAGPRALALALLGSVAGALALPPGAGTQDPDASERQRLFFDMQPATVMGAYGIDATVAAPVQVVELETSIDGGGPGWTLTSDGNVVATTTAAGGESDAAGGMPSWLLRLLALGLVLVAGLVTWRSIAPAPVSTDPAAFSEVAQQPTTALPPSAPGRLVASAGPLKGNRFELDEDGIKIGRDPAACQIVLSDANVSREHALIRPNGVSLTIKNLSGTNPTYVNDRAIQESGLEAGDRVKVGGSVFTVEAG